MAFTNEFNRALAEPYNRRRSLLVIGLGGVLLATAACDVGEQEPQAPVSSIVTTPAPHSAGGVSPRPVFSPGKVYEEIQQFGAATFADIKYASDPHGFIARGQQVTVDCVAAGPVDAAPSTGGMWYHLVNPFPDRYAAANTFENNSDLSLPLAQQNAVDPLVPPCPVDGANRPPSSPLVPAFVSS